MASDCSPLSHSTVHPTMVVIYLHLLHISTAMSLSAGSCSMELPTINIMLFTIADT